jgi:hypothetical protein
MRNSILDIIHWQRDLLDGKFNMNQRKEGNFFLAHISHFISSHYNLQATLKEHIRLSSFSNNNKINFEYSFAFVLLGVKIN